MTYWWVNQNQTLRHEIEGGYLWSPKRNSNGAFNRFYENMKLVEPGDVIYSFSARMIRYKGINSDTRSSREIGTVSLPSSNCTPARCRTRSCFTRRDRLVVLASRYAVPAIPWRGAHQFGGLITMDRALLLPFRLLGTYTGKILKGAKPAELPVQQLTTERYGGLTGQAIPTLLGTRRNGLLGTQP